jgi:hypothetical protein
LRRAAGRPDAAPVASADARDGQTGFPSRVVAIGTKNVHSDKGTPGSRERDVPGIELLAEFQAASR